MRGTCQPAAGGGAEVVECAGVERVKSSPQMPPEPRPLHVRRVGGREEVVAYSVIPTRQSREFYMQFSAFLPLPKSVNKNL